MARHTIPDIIEQADRASRPAASADGRCSLLVVAAPVAVDEESHHLRRADVRPAAARPAGGARTPSAAFAIFCALSGVVYLINDVADREADRRHPVKMHRPIASGALPVRAALRCAVVLGGVGARGRVLAAAAVRRARRRLSSRCWRSTPGR